MQYDNYDSDEKLKELLTQDIDWKELRNASTQRVTIAAPITLTDSNFEQALEKYPLLVVDFWAPWCEPCRMLAPTIDQLASEMAGKVTFGKLNVDENPIITNMFEVRSIPTVIVFKNGDIADGLRGVASKAHLQSMITTTIMA